MILNPIALLLGQVLAPNVNWKALYQEHGEPVVQAKLTDLYTQRVADDLPKIAAKMASEGWSWEAAGDPAFRAKQKVELTPGDEALGAGFVISRDALYAVLRAAGVPGGAARDAMRDAADNKVWAGIQAQVSEATPLLEVVERTAGEWIRVIF